MTVTVQDTVERQLVIPVGRQRVWDAITRPEQIAKWFCDSITMELEPGAPMVLHWEEHGTHRGRVETVEPPARFAFRWTPSGEANSDTPFAEVLTTLVEFTLEETTDGTRLTVLESGFSQIPDDVREQFIRDHTEGWIALTTTLLDYVVGERARQ